MSRHHRPGRGPGVRPPGKHSLNTTEEAAQ
ncbi:hypothetical protein SMD11_5180 [Streptomyces albireticuli]|uniref:Uncharacterized protein n=1 Tax=Streptomyces albireticuli TaxID=1940 RepID=A0A1Z2L907_9ACTN|nr:hypothetical protein SMD11_5180 [Streptomyces albireticuli]